MYWLFKSSALFSQYDRLLPSSVPFVTSDAALPVNVPSSVADPPTSAWPASFASSARLTASTWYFRFECRLRSSARWPDALTLSPGRSRSSCVMSPTCPRTAFHLRGVDLRGSPTVDWVSVTRPSAVTARA